MQIQNKRELLGTAAFVSFLLFVASLAIQRPPIYALFGKEISISDVLFPVCAIVIAVAIAFRSFQPRWDRSYLFFFLYFIAFLLATFAGDNYARSAAKTFATSYLILIAVASSLVIDSDRRLRISILTLLIAAIIPTTIGLFTIVLFYLSPESWLLTYLTYHYGAVPVGNYPRLSSTFISASMFCNFLNVVLIFGLIAWKARWLNARISVILVAAIVMCSIFTISSGLGAVVLCVGAWFWYCQRKSTIGRVVLTAGIAICLISLLASFVALQAHETAPYAFNVVTFIFYPSPRLLVWSEAWHRFIGNFWLGNGPGSPSAEVIFQNSEGGNSLLTDAHNSFLSVATQTGVFGLAAFLAVSLYILRIGYTEVAKNLTRFGLLIAFLSAFVIQGLTGSFEDARHLWFLIGTIIAAYRLFQEESTAEI